MKKLIGLFAGIFLLSCGAEKNQETEIKHVTKEDPLTKLPVNSIFRTKMDLNLKPRSQIYNFSKMSEADIFNPDLKTGLNVLIGYCSSNDDRSLAAGTKFLVHEIGYIMSCNHGQSIKPGTLNEMVILRTEGGFYAAVIGIHKTLITSGEDKGKYKYTLATIKDLEEAFEITLPAAKPVL